MRSDKSLMTVISSGLICISIFFANLAVAADNQPQQPAATTFSRQQWLDDYSYLKTELTHRYANLAWIASPSSGVDLIGLDLRTRHALDSAMNDADASAAILSFVAGFHDQHLDQLVSLESASSPSSPAPKPNLDQLDAATGCAALGYAPTSSISFSLPFESLKDTVILSDGVSQPFRAAIIVTSTGKQIGVIRIPRFRPTDAPPSLCTQAWTNLKASTQHIDSGVLKEKIANDWFALVAIQLKRFKSSEVNAVIVDVAGNSGGNDSGDWLTRLFTANDVHSARLFLTAHESADNYFNEQSDNLHEVAKKTPTKNVAAHNAINEAINAFGLRHDKISTGRCDLGWTWKEQRPWSPLGCNNLIDAGYASGQSDYLPPGSFGDQDVAAAIYWAANVDTYRGAWIGPVYVLVDNKTTSSAEMFAATMKDNGIAKIVGRQTGGAGCGFMGEVAPLVLPNSHLRFRVPNCVRLRKDDSDEVAGIAPDLKIVPRQGESGRDQAFRLIESVGADLK